jgi:biotin synthase
VTSNNPGPGLLELLARNGEQAALHERAAASARTHFGAEVFVRAVVELSNFCRENCHYCGMRRSNRDLNRYRAKFDELAELLLNHLPASVTDVNFQAGEDPVATRELAIPLIQLLQRERDLGVSVCLGTLDHSLYNELREAGASIYILKFETSNTSNYDAFEAPGKLTERLDHIRHLADTGWNVSSGFICGLPNEKPEDWLASLQLANALPLAGCSVSPFVPGESTPLASAETGDIDLVLNCMAAMRLMRPDWIIPAVSALNICQPELGYRRGLRTGANLVTMNLTPAGLRENYVLYKRDRFIMDEERILRALDAEGLKPSKIGLAKFYETRHLNRAVSVPTAAL